MVSLKKNSQPVLVRITTNSAPTRINHLNTAPVIQPFSVTQILNDVCLDASNTLTKQQKAPFVATIAKYSQAFQPDLPGYNNSFGPVYANFQFASSARPPSQKVFTPAYGPHGQLLLHQKFLKLKNKGVLIDPLEHNINPILSHNSWLVKKPAASNIPWEKCQEKDV